MKLPILTLAALTLVTQTAFAADVTVKVSHDALSPAEVTVNVGDTVIFENQVNMPGGHTLLADGKNLRAHRWQRQAQCGNTPLAKWAAIPIPSSNTHGPQV